VIFRSSESRWVLNLLIWPLLARACSHVGAVKCYFIELHEHLICCNQCKNSKASQHPWIQNASILVFQGVRSCRTRWSGVGCWRWRWYRSAWGYNWWWTSDWSARRRFKWGWRSCWLNGVRGDRSMTRDSCGRRQVSWSLSLNEVDVRG